MSLSYATTLTRISQFLQDTGLATYDATELGMWLEDELKRISPYDPYLLDVIFQVESRTGTDVTGTASSLTDLVKLQFLAADATNEKVIHNTTDDTWAVVTGYTSTSVLTISKDIMDADETYEIFNKRCRNKKQIYIGDMPFYLWVESVEYPVGTERNFHLVSKDILEIDVDDATIKDSDSTLATLNKVDVLIRFAIPRVLCQLADLAGAVHTEGATGATTLQVKSFTDAQVVEVGELFNIADHRTTYIVTTELTLANQATTGSSLLFYPGLEAVASADGVITFVKSTLQPDHEEILADLVAARAKISDAERHHIQAIADLTTGRALLNTINKGGVGGVVPSGYAQYAGASIQVARELIATAKGEQADIIRRLRSLANPKTAKEYART